MLELLTASAYGVTVGLQVGAGALPAVLAELPHWWHTSPAPNHVDRTWRVASGASQAVAEATVAELELWVAEHAVDRIFVHAGVVAVEGRGLLLPGRSFAGKTTLTAALVRAGATYGSDEYAPLRHDGQVETYARPLWIRSTDGGPRIRMSAAELGGRTFSGAIAVGGIAMLHFHGAAGWDVDVISPGAGVLGMVDNCVPAQSRPAAMLDTLTAVALGARCWQGTRGSADDAAGRLLELMTAA